MKNFLVFAAVLILQSAPSALFGNDVGRWADPRIVYMTDGGSASFADVGGKTYIISCAHRTATTSVKVGERVGFLCNDGTNGTATVAAVDPINLNSEPLHDCAIYSFVGTLDKAVRPFSISKRAMRRGETVWVCGFPMSRGFSCRQTTLVSDDGTLVLAGQSTPGESGGPIVNSDGELIGTLTATSAEERLTVCCGRGPELALCQNLLAQCGSCQSGSCGSCQMGCSSGSCQGYYQQAPPQYYPPTRPQQPTTPTIPSRPSVTSIPGPQGPAGPAGPAGKDGRDGIDGKDGGAGASGRDGKDADEATIEANVWAKVENRLSEIAGQQPSVDEIANELEKRRQPPRIRIVDPQGKYTTPYSTLRDGYDTDLIIDQRFTQAH